MMGLINPLCSYHFRLDLHGHGLFQKSVETFSMNVVKKQITVTVRESYNCEIMPLIVNLASYRSTSMTWEGMDKNSGGTVATMFFHGLELIDHEFSNSYTDTGSAKHVLTFSYKRMDKQ